MNVDEKIYVDKSMRDENEQRDPDALNADTREPIEDSHPGLPFSFVALSYIVVLFVTAIGVTVAVAIWNAFS